MGLLTFALNLTLDGCQDHRAGIPDDELLDWFTTLMDGAGAALQGRITYELMESAWPQIARDESAPRAMREWAVMLEAKPKFVVSATRREYSWANTVHVEGDLIAAVNELKASTPKGVVLGGPALAAQLVDLIDEYRFVIHPVLAGHGPTLFAGLDRRTQLKLVSTRVFTSGAIAVHYRRAC